MNATAIRCVFLGAVFLASGCTKEAPPGVVEEETVPEPKVFAFTNTCEVVAAEDIKAADERRVVRADFNQDGMADMAVVRTDVNNAGHVDIYTRKAPSPGLPKEKMKTLYFRAGAIHRSLEGGKIIGIASSVGEKSVDLILLVEYTNRPNEMIHYHNDGSRFSEESAISGKAIQAAPAPKAPHK